MVLWLAGCGGGDHDAGEAASPSPAPPASVPLLDAVLRLDDTGYERLLPFTGSLSGELRLKVEGPLSVSSSPHDRATTFNGQPALASTSAVIGILRVDRDQLTVSLYEERFNSSGHALLGVGSGARYCVAASFDQVPVTASVGTSGTLARLDCYADSTVAVPVGRQTISYEVTPGTTSSNLTFTRSHATFRADGTPWELMRYVFLVDTEGRIELYALAITLWAGNTTLDIVGR